MNIKTDVTKFPHEEIAEFRGALEYTQGVTGFRSELIEKDYYCSLVLRSLYQRKEHKIVFKGGTCLNKVYMGFFRLSEDLVFSVSVPVDATRGTRSNLAKLFNSLFESIVTDFPGVSIGIPLKGANNSTQYMGELLYQSALSSDHGRIKIEVGLREELCDPVATVPANTLAQDPFSQRSLVSRFDVNCLSLQEALAEKIRAIFTRRDIAIRDLFDYWHAHSMQKIDFSDKTLLEMAAKKIAQSTTPYVSFSTERLNILNLQLTTDLRPVLSEADFKSFPLTEAVAKVKELECKIVQLLRM